MQTNRIENVERISSNRISSPKVSVPVGFVLVPAQFFQAQGGSASAWQRNLYAAAFEQARQSVFQARRQLFRQSQVMVLN